MDGKDKLIVTGMSGLIGSRLAALASKTLELINVDIVEGVDIADRDQLARAVERHAEGAEALIHLAAYTDVSRAYGQTDNHDGPCYRINVVGAGNVAEACRAHGLRLIHVSTDFVFDGEKSEPYAEDDPANPIEWYGKTKLLGEQAAREAGHWTIARIAFPYVPAPSVRPDLVRKIRARLQDGEEANLFDDQIITPTCADDIVRGLLLLARVPAGGEVFHLTGSTSLSPFDLGRKIAEAWNLDASLARPSSLGDYLKRDPRPRQRSLRMDNAKWSDFARRHGLSAPLDIDAGLRHVVAGLSASSS